MDLVKKLYDIYFRQKGDPRVANYWFMQDIGFTLCASILYVTFVKYVGPKIMEKRKPFQLKNTLLVYNAFQIILSAYIFNKVFEKEWFTTSRLWKCYPIDYTTNKNGIRVLDAFYIYYLSKFSEYLDTIFFVLRKKNNQISFLHLYHHASMPFWIWLTVKYYGGGSMLVIPLFNSFVHIIMYTYYLLAGLGSRVQKYLWWKKYITTLQLFQFSSGTCHYLLAVLDFRAECNIPKYVTLITLSCGVFFYALFKNFYKTAYGGEGTPKKKDS